MEYTISNVYLVDNLNNAFGSADSTFTMLSAKLQQVYYSVCMLSASGEVYG